MARPFLERVIYPDVVTDEVCDDIVTGMLDLLSKYDMTASAYKITGSQFLHLYHHIASKDNISSRVHNYINDVILKKNHSPRTYFFTGDQSKNHLDRINNKSDDWGFYELSKVYNFMVNPPEYFRLPMSVGELNGNMVIHPGNTRITCLSFLEEDLPLTMIVSDYSQNKKIKDWIDQHSYQGLPIIDENRELLKNVLHIKELYSPHLLWRVPEGIQITEPMQKLKEHHIDYLVEFDGSNFHINNRLVIYKENNRFKYAGQRD